MNLNYIEALEHMIELEQEVIKLKELNREMVEALRDIQAFIVALKAYIPVGIDSLSSYKAVMKQTQTVLAKAEGEVPPGIVVGYNFKKMKDGEG